MVFVSFESVVETVGAAGDENPFAVRVTPGSPPKPVKTVSPVKTLDDEFVVFVSDKTTHDRWAIRKTYRQVVAFQRDLRDCIHSCRRFACCGPLRRVAKARLPRKATTLRFTFDATTRYGLDASAAHRTMSVEEYVNEAIQATNGRDAECPSLDSARTVIDVFLELASRRQAKAEATVEALMAGLQIHDVSVNLECPVCLNGFPDDTSSVQLPCSHVFHSACAEQWLAKSPTCPVCRSTLNVFN
ncbi:hypothetical protein ACHHYP_02792 [Achlya hypogyna]|uniref:RING-type domain-containing protein n=1 Tax=Achlya hypogyna TaxID=1202772 RepID=A0A1V9Z5N1_ACHHY|nr:hypothetical protein ACHHYP_02792 [Achlya hypogyna]